MKHSEIRKILLQLNIENPNIKIIKNDNLCTVALVTINNFNYYFKFLPVEQYDKMNKEVEIVNYLSKKKVKVQEYYNYKGKKVFKNEKYSFYGTKEIISKNTTKIEYKLLKNIVNNISNMHKNLIDIEIKNKNINLENDYQRFKKFYIDNIDTLKKHNLENYAKNALKDGIDDRNYYYIHHDLNLSNMILTNKNLIFFIDFTDYCTGYLEDDLGKFIQNLLYIENITLDQIKKLISLYQKSIGVEISNKNLLLSTTYRILYRYLCYIKENNDIEEYNTYTIKILNLIKEKNLYDKRSCI